ncbi:hypothetical protein [Nostoc sp.]|uniref:hypothetical protein n=1 Tax=Nostoc sp. TaxID=1180 RepID=UPI002FFAC529
MRTMYMAVDDPDNLPVEFLKNISRIGLGFNNDDRDIQLIRHLQIVPKKGIEARFSGKTKEI